MEKLIKLLNEYTWEEYTHHNDGGWFEWEEPDYDWVCLDVRLKDKDYWFIKRLIENDKVNVPELDLAPWKENTIIMMLSISSSPLNDLFTLLK